MSASEYAELLTDLHALRSNIAAKLPALQCAGSLMLATYLEAARDSITRAIAELNTSRPAELSTAPVVYPLPRTNDLNRRKHDAQGKDKAG